MDACNPRASRQCSWMATSQPDRNAMVSLHEPQWEQYALPRSNATAELYSDPILFTNASGWWKWSWRTWSGAPPFGGSGSFGQGPPSPQQPHGHGGAPGGAPGGAGGPGDLTMWANYADHSAWDPARWNTRAKTNDDLKQHPFDGVMSNHKDWRAHVINHLLGSNQGWGRSFGLSRRKASPSPTNDCNVPTSLD